MLFQIFQMCQSSYGTRNYTTEIIPNSLFPSITFHFLPAFQAVKGRKITVYVTIIRNTLIM